MLFEKVESEVRSSPSLISALMRSRSVEISLDERIDEKNDDIRFSIGAGAMNAVRDFAQGKDSFIENKYGRIVYSYGRPGTITEKGKIAHGEGLLHIVYSRMAKDGKSLNQAVETAIRVGDAIEKGVVARKIRNKLIFQKDGYEGVVAKTGTEI